MKKLQTFFNILAFLFCILPVVNAQNASLQEEPQITSLMAKYLEVNKATTLVPGWRVQVFATTDRERIDQEKKNFRALFPGIWADWTHSSPYYRLKAGAFSNKLEAQRLLYRLRDTYPGGFVVQDNAIRPVDLLAR